MKFTPAVFILFILSGFFFWGCKPMPNDGIPFYMKVDSVSLVLNNVNHPPQLVNSQAIRDIWAEADAENLGAHEIPTNFPVLLEGDVRFVLSAGIEQNGVAGDRFIYPFYTSDTFTLNAKRDTIYTRTPQFHYLPGCQFKFVDNFEAGSVFSGLAFATDTNVKYGLTCGKISVTASDSSEMATSLDALPLTGGNEIWLEFDYKSEVPFYVGYYGEGGGIVVQVPMVFVNARGYWNHLYVKLSEAIAATDAPGYRIYFEALRPFGSNGGSVYIDNVRLVHN